MFWIDLAVGASVGLLALIVVRLVLGKSEDNNHYYSIFLVAIIISVGVAEKFVVPKLKGRYAASKVDAELLSNPALASLQKYDSATYKQLKDGVTEAVVSGRSKEEVRAALRGKVMKIVLQRMPIATDGATLVYVRVLIEEMKELQRQQDDLCFRFLYPGTDASLDVSRYLSKETIEDDLDALGEILRTSSVDPQPIPRSSEVQSGFELLGGDLKYKFGRDILMLRNPYAQGVNKDRVCTMTIFMYKRILDLQRDEAGKLLRYIMANGP